MTEPIKNPAAVALGRMAAGVKTARKTESSRRNAALAREKKAQKQLFRELQKPDIFSDKQPNN